MKLLQVVLQLVRHFSERAAFQAQGYISWVSGAVVQFVLNASPDNNLRVMN